MSKLPHSISEEHDENDCQLRSYWGEVLDSSGEEFGFPAWAYSLDAATKQIISMATEVPWNLRVASVTVTEQDA